MMMMKRGSIADAARDHGNCLYGTRKWFVRELVVVSSGSSCVVEWFNEV